jgi:hypothetical protein
MRKRQDLTGQVFGTIKVLEPAGKNKHNQNIYLCLCLKCGKNLLRRTNETKNGCPSCSKKRHGERFTRLYRIWCGMKYRCHSDKYYERINFFIDWTKFEVFKEWAISNGYKSNLELDRIDVKGDYCPENCRWVNDRKQANNKRNNKYIEREGVVNTLPEWARIYGKNMRTIWTRIRRGWKNEDALKIKVDKTKGQSQVKKYFIGGISKSLYEWCEVFQISHSVVKKRMKRGMTLAQALGVSNG